VSVQEKPKKTAEKCKRMLHFFASPQVYAPLALLILFWYFRSSTFRGDGDQIDRIIENGTWWRARQMLSQATLQLSWRLLRPWHFDGMMTNNLISCLGGVVFYHYLIRLAQERFSHWLLPFLVFLTSGFTIIFCGHTEYYSMLLACTMGMLYCVDGYLKGKRSLFAVALWASFVCWFHSVGLIILPALLYLWWVGHRNRRDMSLLILGLLPIAVLIYLIRIIPISLGDLGPVVGDRWVPLFKIPVDSDLPKFYTFFSLGHLHDMLFWIFKASPLLLPATLFIIIKRTRYANWYRDPFHVFLALCGALWMAWTLVWHPDLTIYQDWDLFAVAALPPTWLCMSLLLKDGRSKIGWIVVVLLLLSALPTWRDTTIAARFGERGRGHLRLLTPGGVAAEVVFIDGHRKSLETYNILEGKHFVQVAMSNPTRVVEQTVQIRPGEWVEVRLEDAPSSGNKTSETTTPLD
jgi:hypothetical protein